MAIGVALLVGVVVLGALFLLLGGSAGLSMSRRERALDERDEQLRYRVPAGQDPALLVAALHKDGYDAAAVTEQGSPVVAVACLAGRDAERAHVRAVIASTRSTGFEGASLDARPVTFEDEDA